MPSREEIVGLLQEAADAAVSCQIDFKLFHRLKECAAQVKNMCCETCDNYIPEENGESCMLKQSDYQGKSFGCFSWEAKEN